MLEINTQHFHSLPENFYKVKQNLEANYILDADNQIELQFLFSQHNPFFEHGTAMIEIIDDKARCVIFKNNSSEAYFGYFESENDQDVCNELMNRCESWARAQGITKLIGPINFNTYNQYRINLSAQEDLFFNEPKNPPYYKNLLKECGYKILNEYLTYIVDNKKKIITWYEQYKSKITLLDFDGSYEYIKLTPEFWLENIKELHQKSEMTFGDNFAYSPIKFELFALKYGETFSKLFCPETSLIVRHKTDGICGIMLNFPNYQEGADSKTLLFKTIGLLPEHRKMGYHILRMLLEIAPNAIEKYEKYIFCLMQKDNYPSKLGREFMDREKRYALYHKDLN